MDRISYLPLSGEVAETGGDTQQEAIIALKGGVGEDGDVGILGRSIHLGQDIVGEGLGDLVQVDGDTGLLSALLLSLGQGLDVAVHGVL